MAVATLFSVFLLWPVGALVLQSAHAAPGGLGWAAFAEFLGSPGVGDAAWNTLWIAVLVTAITVPAAYLYAYAVQRACLPFKGLWRLLGLSPLLGPSLLGAISFVQWFGTQGVLKSWLGDNSVYGPIGIVLATCYSAFPHALMIVLVALATADGRLYEAATAMGASRLRRFWTVTLPGTRYGLVSAALVVFCLSVSEFGIPKVIGGNFKVLAVEVYIQVVGLQNFARGGMVALLLLAPVLVAFLIDRHVQARQHAAITARATPYVPRSEHVRDGALALYVVTVAVAMLAILGMAVYTSVIKFWPYNLELTLHHYVFGLEEAGVKEAYVNSLTLAALTALVGTPIVFTTAYLMEKTSAHHSALRTLVQALASLPTGVPGLVLGIGYILVFNDPGNPLAGLYHSMAILVAVTIVHYYTTCHLTALTALKALDREFESVSASLKVSQFTTFWRITFPVCLPAILEIARYLFVNAMTTVSALVFLYAPSTMPATVSILNLDEAGELGPAAAMGTLIVLTALAVSALHAVLEAWLLRRGQAWRNPHHTHRSDHEPH